MIAVEDVVLVLLAGGISERFGDLGSKLDEDFLGRPLGLHVAVALEDMPFRERVVVQSRCSIDYAAHRFRVIHNDDPRSGMAHAIRLGIASAKEMGAEAVLIALADMPRVTAAHIYRMFDVSRGPDTVVASSDGVEPKPPGLFGRERFDFLMGLDDDAGAHDLVRTGRHVVTSPAELIDVDTPADLEALRGLVHSHEAVARAEGRMTGE